MTAEDADGKLCISVLTCRSTSACSGAALRALRTLTLTIRIRPDKQNPILASNGKPFSLYSVLSSRKVLLRLNRRVLPSCDLPSSDPHTMWCREGVLDDGFTRLGNTPLAIRNSAMCCRTLQVLAPRIGLAAYSRQRVDVASTTRRRCRESPRGCERC
jgi:hypothetical protein